jgi:predicted transcriptional regulator
MEKHYGQILELVIRKQGFSISELARLANVNRKCIYKWFDQKHLKAEIIYRVGELIDHDFAVEHPELLKKENFRGTMYIRQPVKTTTPSLRVTSPGRNDILFC